MDTSEVEIRNFLVGLGTSANAMYQQRISRGSVLDCTVSPLQYVDLRMVQQNRMRPA